MRQRVLTMHFSGAMCRLFQEPDACGEVTVVFTTCHNDDPLRLNLQSLFDFSKKKWDLTRMHVVLLARCLDSVRQSEI